MADPNDGFFSGLLGGLFGPSDDDLAALRLKYGIPAAEAPSPMVSMGRGFADVWEPLKQTYLNLTDPNQAQAYTAQRAEDEGLYQRGLLSANPMPTGAWAQAHPDEPPQVGSDFWRMMGRTAPVGLAAPLIPATLPEAVMSSMLTTGVYDAIGAARHKFGSSIAPWLELPNVFR